MSEIPLPKCIAVIVLLLRPKVVMPYQAVNLGVALPEWLFSKDQKSAPIVRFTQHFSFFHSALAHLHMIVQIYGGGESGSWATQHQTVGDSCLL